MKLISTNLQITSNNQKLYSVHYQTTEKDFQLVLNSIENYLQILFDNEHITLTGDCTEPLCNNKYHSWYLEPIDTKEIPSWDKIKDLASYLENYFGYQHDQAMHIVLLNLTPLTQALNTKYDSYIYYNTDDYVMEITEKPQPEECSYYAFINIPHINGNIYIIID
jgi:hypothetical protein